MQCFSLENGFCNAEFGEYNWPETMANTLAVIACEGGTASRFCSIAAQWEEPSTDQCGEISQGMFMRSI